MSNLIDHVERNIGPIKKGWVSPTADMLVASIVNRPASHMCTYITLGLSNYVLSMPDGRSVRQEIVFCQSNDIDDEQVSRFLMRMAGMVVTRRKGLLRGDVIGPGKPIFYGFVMNAVYISMPVIFDDGLVCFNGTSPPTVVPWMIPVHEDESVAINEIGWNKFEETLERIDPNLCDLRRSSIAHQIRAL